MCILFAGSSSRGAVLGGGGGGAGGRAMVSRVYAPGRPTSSTAVRGPTRHTDV